MAAAPGQQEWGMRMIVVSRCIERIGDNAVDIGEQTAFLVTGEFTSSPMPPTDAPVVHQTATGAGLPSPSTDVGRQAGDRRPAVSPRQIVEGEGVEPMKKSLAAALALVALARRTVVAGRGEAAPAKSQAGSLVGAGATFPFPLISKWIPAVGKAYGINITYSPTGSGAGIAAITARTVDFGASDAPLSPDQLDACKGCVVIPWALVGDVRPVQPAGRERPRCG